MQVIHTAIWTSDLDRMTEFFEDDIGLEHSHDFVGNDGVTNYYVGGDEGATIQLKHDPDENKEIDPSGIAHVAISVDDSKSLAERLSNRDDCRIVDGPKEVNDGISDKRIAFVEGPDGYVYELEQTLE
ncbi:VOC family protein [Haloarcula sp. JP-L23]|uniref:VOC family protein n=1 Tax=Haloarcula sp. JP-L23 TaxID=2716717 RepID=UPI00140F334D|nr:VOC family protein [Haloarcula sp. JP-L23]